MLSCHPTFISTFGTVDITLYKKASYNFFTVRNKAGLWVLLFCRKFCNWYLEPSSCAQFLDRFKSYTLSQNRSSFLLNENLWILCAYSFYQIYSNSSKIRVLLRIILRVPWHVTSPYVELVSKVMENLVFHNTLVTTCVP